MAQISPELYPQIAQAIRAGQSSVEAASALGDQLKQAGLLVPGTSKEYPDHDDHVGNIVDPGLQKYLRDQGINSVYYRGGGAPRQDLPPGSSIPWDPQFGIIGPPYQYGGDIFQATPFGGQIHVSGAQGRGGGGGFLDSNIGRGLAGALTGGTSELFRQPAVQQAGIGGLGGFLAGGAPGAAAGSLAGGLQSLLGRPTTLGTGLQSLGQGALLGGLLGGRIPGQGFVGGELGGLPTPSVQPPIFPGIGLPNLGNILGQIGGFDLGRLNLPQARPQVPGQPQQPSQGILGRLGSILTGIPGQIGGGLQSVFGQDSKLGGLLGGIRGQIEQPGDVLGNLSTLGGLGLLGYGLAQGQPEINLEEAFGSPEASAQSGIEGQIAQERALRQAAEQQFLGGRQEARQRLEDILSRESQADLSRNIQLRQEQLNRQGLLTGPSGALNEALAQEVGRVRSRALPQLLAFEEATQGGLEKLRGGGLEGELGLGRAGVERQFQLGGERRQTRLLDKVLEAERKRAERQQLLQLGSAAIGFGRPKGGGLQGIQDILQGPPQQRGGGFHALGVS